MYKNDIVEMARIYVRYEPMIKNGTLFMFNKDNGEILEGNKDLYDIVNLIDGTNTVNEIIKKISSLYEIEEDIIENDILDTIDYLINKKFVRIYYDDKDKGSNC